MPCSNFVDACRGDLFGKKKKEKNKRMRIWFSHHIIMLFPKEDYLLNYINYLENLKYR